MQHANPCAVACNHPARYLALTRLHIARIYGAHPTGRGRVTVKCGGVRVRVSVRGRVTVTATVTLTIPVQVAVAVKLIC